MTQVKLNKSALSLQRKNLKNYQRYLPSLELKRKKLLSVRVHIDENIKQLKETEVHLKEHIKNNLPMVSGMITEIRQMIHVDAVDIAEENIAGVNMPVFKSVKYTVDDYAWLNTPHWFEAAIQAISELVSIRLQMRTLLLQQEILAKAIKTVTQRKNLFEKVLIPDALKQIRLIQIFLADNERAAVVSSKIAKRKREML
ncbi:V-type ATP synthase subunit D [Legionella quinlivanii]|uniref:V-type ATP synthase subunit D n=1 Tax=Legionella quinlivanii TaxID=45073 RepID=A0A364LN23_9GAMM|nr:V-type ATP synthase subunit D [Legionella quinlivanii]RAP38446.1 V-type ATP synthase subunit D [Legionella quinlivanii]